MGNPQHPHQPPAEPGPYDGGAPGRPPLPRYSPGQPPPVPPAPPHFGPPYGAPGVPGAPGPGRPPRKRKTLWIVLGIAGGVLLLVIAGVVLLVNLVGGAAGKARGLAEDFTRLVIAGDTDAAYEKHFSPLLMARVSPENFAAGIAGLQFEPSCTASYDSFHVATSNGVNSADIGGVITCAAKKVEFAYRYEGRDELKMINIRLKPVT